MSTRSPPPPTGCGSPHCTVIIVCSCPRQVVQQAQLLLAQQPTYIWACHIKAWRLGATCLLSGGGRRRERAWSLGAPRRLRLSLLYCNNYLALAHHWPCLLSEWVYSSAKVEPSQTAHQQYNTTCAARSCLAAKESQRYDQCSQHILQCIDGYW